MCDTAAERITCLYMIPLIIRPRIIKLEIEDSKTEKYPYKLVFINGFVRYLSSSLR